MPDKQKTLEEFKKLLKEGRIFFSNVKFTNNRFEADWEIVKFAENLQNER